MGKKILVNYMMPNWYYFPLLEGAEMFGPDKPCCLLHTLTTEGSLFSELLKVLHVHFTVINHMWLLIEPLAMAC